MWRILENMTTYSELLQLRKKAPEVHETTQESRARWGATFQSLQFTGFGTGFTGILVDLGLRG